MSEFRQERRPINASEINAGEEKLNQINQIRSASNAENESIKISGNIPPAFQSLVNSSKEVSQSGPRQKNSGDGVFNNVSSSQLEKLLQEIKDKKLDHEKIVLPSKGKFYDGQNGPIDGVLHVRPMTGEEEEILATPRFVKAGIAIDKIFDKCIQEKYSSENFLTIDRTYLLIFLRGISYSPLYDVNVECPICNKKFATEIDLNTLTGDWCPDDFGPNRLDDVLPNTGFKFKYRLSTGADERIVNAYRERRIKEFNTSTLPDDTLHYRASLMLEEIEGVTHKNELQKLLKALPIDDLSYIRNMVNDPPFGINTKVEIICASCTQEFEIDMPLEASFFFPRTRKAVKM